MHASSVGMENAFAGIHYHANVMNMNTVIVFMEINGWIPYKWLLKVGHETFTYKKKLATNTKNKVENRERRKKLERGKYRY